MDRKETDLRRGDAEANPSVAVSDPSGEELASRIAELHQQGQSRYAAGRYEEAIHVWTRILFFDRSNPEARKGIETARRDLAERQRRLDLDVAEAGRLFAAGDADGARRLLESVLASDASHNEAAALASKLAALERKLDPAAGTRHDQAFAEGRLNARGILVRVPRGQPSVGAPGSSVATRLYMAAFVLGALMVFAASGLYLKENWDSLVGGGAFGGTSGSASVPALDPTTIPVPQLSDVHYFKGVRLFEQDRYREALGELSRVDRSSPHAAEARSLIVRIEERLLRDGTEPSPGAGPPEATPAKPRGTE